MKVLHVIPSLSPALGGPTVVALELVRYLRARGIDAEIVTTNDDGERTLDVPLYQRTIYQQVPVWFLPRFSLPMKEFLFSAALTRWLWQHVADYDLLDLHYLFSYAPTCAGVISRRKRVPYTVRTQGQLSAWALRQRRYKKRVYGWLIERSHLNEAAAIHCTTPQEAEDVRRYGITAPTKVLPLGVESWGSECLIPDYRAREKLRRRYGVPCDRPIILFLSRLHHTKQPDVLLRAMHQLAQRGCSAHLVLAGTGDEAYVRKLKRLIASLNLESIVTLAGFVAGADKRLLLQGSDVFALPSQTENFSIATAEAMVARLPVVITPDVQIAPDVVMAGAGLVADGTCSGFVGAIATLLANPVQRRQMGVQGKAWAQQHYDWPVIAEGLSQAYAGILRQQSHKASMATLVAAQ